MTHVAFHFISFHLGTLVTPLQIYSYVCCQMLPPAGISRMRSWWGGVSRMRTWWAQFASRINSSAQGFWQIRLVHGTFKRGMS